MATSLLLALALSGSSASSAAAQTPVALNVPYLPQTDALCGGAAVAMVFRYWGDRYADVAQFEPLVDRRAGGIREDVLIDAIRERTWQARSSRGSIGALQVSLAAGQPLILLIRDRPQRYHYVVAVGIDDTHVYIHDPTWGPSRPYDKEELQRVWAPTGFWVLRVTPMEREAREALEPIPLPFKPGSPCDRLVAGAIAASRARGRADVELDLANVARECPDDSRPLSELAGLRFSERRWRAAAALAEDALSLDRADKYAWDVLASSRFLLDDREGALTAWNEIDRPRVDTVHISGLSRTKYALVSQWIGLRTNTLLTPSDFRVVRRRLRELPSQSGSSVSYQPDANGFAVLDATIVEHRRLPHGGAEWGAVAVRSLVDREIQLLVPGRAGEGEVWGATWRWWPSRPQLAASFAAPKTGRLAGVWQVGISWDAQEYAPASDLAIREEHLRGSLGISRWLTGNLRYELTGGLDSWNGLQAASLGGVLDRRLLSDRLSFVTAVQGWASDRSFATIGLAARYRSSVRPQGLVLTTRIAAEHATEAAPLGLWPGAGAGHARAALLRAHPLVADGVVTGAAFGRQLLHLTAQAELWPKVKPLGAMVPVGVAAFVDAAHTTLRAPGASGGRVLVDSGIGLRLALPGGDQLRVDYARGLQDTSQALSVGITRAW